MSYKYNQVIFGILILFPIFYLAYLLNTYALGLPVCDQWAYVDLVKKTFDGTLRWADLWAQLDNLRDPVPRILILTMAYFSQWNMFFELIAILVTVTVTFTLVIILTRRTETDLGFEHQYWLWPVLATFVFSLIQYENWFWGFALNFYIGNLGIVACLILLSTQKLHWRLYGFTLVVAVIASLASIYGFLLWPIGFLLLIVSHTDQFRTTMIRLVTWCVVGATLVFLYLQDYSFSGTAFPKSPAEPIAYFSFILNYLASPLYDGTGVLSACIGLFGLAALLALPTWLVKSGRISITTIAPYVALGLYPVGAAILAAIGRAPMGSSGASLRYTTASIWLWITLTILLYFAIRTSLKSNSKLGNKILAWSGMWSFPILLFITIDPLRLILWRLPEDIPLAWWLCGLGLLIYIIMIVVNKRYRKTTMNAHAFLLPLIFISILGINQSFHKGRIGAIWDTDKHFSPLIDIVVNSKKFDAESEEALKKLYCGISVPMEKAKARVNFLRENHLAAFRE